MKSDIAFEDMKLIAEAEALPCTEWPEIETMKQRAHSQRTKCELEAIMRRKNHQEEYLAGWL